MNQPKQVFVVLRGAEFYRAYTLGEGNWTTTQADAKRWKTEAGALRQAKTSQALYAKPVRVVSIAA